MRFILEMRYLCINQKQQQLISKFTQQYSYYFCVKACKRVKLLESLEKALTKSLDKKP